jgi:membrane protein
MVKRRIKAVYQQLEIVSNRFGEHHLTDWAAALTYFAVFSIFPGLLALVSLLGIVGHGTSQAVIDTLAELPDGPAREILLSAAGHVQGETSAATTALLVGLGVATYAASRYIGAFIRAAGLILHVEETRRFFVTIPLRLALTVLLMLLTALTAVAIVLTGPIATEFTRLTGFEASALGGWGFIKWPLVLLLFYFSLGVLYSLGPDFENKRLRVATAGSTLALVLWLVASVLFSLFVANFAHYNKVFGSLAGAAIFLVWIYWSNVSVLLGLELDHELQRFKRKYGYGAFSRQRFQREDQPADS